MTTLGTFHAWFALVCDAEAEELAMPREADQWTHLSNMAGDAARRSHDLGTAWRDAMAELGR